MQHCSTTLLHKPAYLYTMPSDWKYSPSSNIWLPAGFYCLQPFRISPVKKHPAYTLFLLFHHETIPLRVFQTQTITSTPKPRSWAKLLHSTSEILGTRAKIDHYCMEILESAPASLWILFGPLNLFFFSFITFWSRERRQEKRRDEIFFSFQIPNEASKWETQAALPSISWEHRTHVCNIFVQQLFYVRIALWNSPRCWLPEAFTAVLESTPSPLVLHHSFKNEHTGEAQAPLITCRVSHPNTI